MQNEQKLESSPRAAAPRGLRTAGIVAALVAISVVTVGAIARTGDVDEAQHWSDARSIPTVHLVAASSSGAADPLTLPGTMEAWNDAKLYARVGGYVKQWYRDIGAQVGAGTPLGRIDTPELDQQIVQARADLSSSQANAGLAKSTAARWDDLLTTNSVSKQEADEKDGDRASKEAAVQAARANLDRLLALKNFAVLRAPFAGIVTTRNADIGDLVGPGATGQQPLFAVDDVSRIRVYVSVPQVFSAAMHQGATATLNLPDYAGHPFTAHVIGNSGAIDSRTGTFQVQLVADNPDHLLKPGGYAQVRFDLPGGAGTVHIPSNTLLFRSQGTQVATVGPGDRIHLRRVTIGRDLGQTVEITSGLHATDDIVDNPPDSLDNGELVRVAAARHG